MTTDRPKLDNRDEFIEWMEGKTFRFDPPDQETIQFKALGKREEQNEREPPGEMGKTDVSSTYLEYIPLETESAEVEGSSVNIEVTLLKEPEDAETEKVRFDSIRVQYLRGEITEL